MSNPLNAISLRAWNHRGQAHECDLGDDLGAVAVVVFVAANSRPSATCLGLLARFAYRDFVLRYRGLGRYLQFLRRLDCLFGLSLCVFSLERMDRVAHASITSSTLSSANGDITSIP